jgi:hypothetical protein
MAMDKVDEIHYVKERDIEKWIMPQIFWNLLTQHWKLSEHKINKIHSKVASCMVTQHIKYLEYK